MREIIVYDFGFSSQGMAEFLEDELPIKVRRVIDPREIDGKSNREIQELAIETLTPYIGGAEVIVITNPLVVAVAIERLRSEFPSQKFVGYGQGVTELIRQTKRVFVLAPKRIQRLELYQKMKAECQKTEINEPDCSKWVRLIDRGWLAKEEMIEETKVLNGAKVVVIDPEMVMRGQKVEEMVGWRGEVVDMKAEMLEQLKMEMGLQKWR